jgi:hypothetical protein
MLKKKKEVVIAPESKLMEATIVVEQQFDQFKKMVEEVEYAKGLRYEAMEELQREIISLENKLKSKQVALENAQLQNKADDGFIQRLNELMGL